MAVKDADTFGLLPWGHDEERSEGRNPCGDENLQSKRAPGRSRLAQDGIPIRHARRLGNEPVESFLNVLHRWASFNEFRSAA